MFQEARVAGTAGSATTSSAATASAYAARNRARHGNENLEAQCGETAARSCSVRKSSSVWGLQARNIVPACEIERKHRFHSLTGPTCHSGSKGTLRLSRRTIEE